MRKIAKHISMNKEHMMQLCFALFFAMVIVTILLSSGATSTENTIQGGKSNKTSNITFAQCIINSSITRDSCYNTSRITANTCRVAALNETVKNNAKIKKCGTDFTRDIKKCKSDNTAAKAQCKSIKHTFLDELSVAKYE